MYEEGCSVTKIASYLECAISSVNNYLSFRKYNKNKKKESVVKYLKEGISVKKISEITTLSERTIYRIKSELSPELSPECCQKTKCAFTNA